MKKSYNRLEYFYYKLSMNSQVILFIKNATCIMKSVCPISFHFGY